MQTGEKHLAIQIPAAVKAFATRAAIVLIAWILVYHVLLKPHRIPDRALSNVTAAATAKVLSWWYYPATSMEKNNFACVVMDGVSVIRIGDPCNALDLMALYVAFIICIPTTKKRMFFFSLAGIGAVFILNVLRCYSLTLISLNRHEWLDFAHKYLFTAVVYCFIFYGWILYLKKYRQ